RRGLEIGHAQGGGAVFQPGDGAVHGEQVEQVRIQAVDGYPQFNRAADQVVQPPAVDDPPTVDNRHTVTHHLDLAQQVRVQENRNATLAQRTDQVPHLPPANRVECRC